MSLSREKEVWAEWDSHPTHPKGGVRCLEHPCAFSKNGVTHLVLIKDLCISLQSLPGDFLPLGDGPTEEVAGTVLGAGRGGRACLVGQWAGQQAFAVPAVSARSSGKREAGGHSDLLAQRKDRRRQNNYNTGQQTYNPYQQMPSAWAEHIILLPGTRIKHWHVTVPGQKQAGAEAVDRGLSKGSDGLGPSGAHTVRASDARVRVPTLGSPKCSTLVISTGSQDKHPAAPCPRLSVLGPSPL